jgi:conjugative transfer signal peptidase TraF
MRGWRHYTRIAGLCLFGIALLAVSSTHELVLANESLSMPRGLYLRDRTAIERGAIVTVRAVDVAPEESVRRHFTAPGNRFIKRVAAVGGDCVCAFDQRVLINGRLVAIRKERAEDGRELARWSGCVTLDADHVLLLGNTGNSFDGRYWGPVDRALVEGVWRHL